MKNKYDLFTFIKIISMLIMFPVTLSASGISIGGIMSVYDDGPFNTTKNPALLTRTDSSFGAILYGSPYTKGTTTTFEINGIDSGSSNTDSRKTLSSNLSFVKSSKKMSFGLSFALQEDDNYYSRKSSGTYSGSDKFSNNEKSNAIGTYLSAAYKINSFYSFGLRLYSAYKKESKEEIKIDSMETVKKTNIDSFAINPSLGFHGINRRYRMEFGIILSCGTFLKKRYDYSFNRSDLKNGDESYSSQFEMAKSPSITFGVLKRYKKSSFLAESIFYIPSKYDDRDFSVDDTAGIIVVRDSKRSNSFGFEQKLGYEYSLSSSTAFSCGIGYWQIRQNDDLSTSSESRKNSTNVRILFSSFGFDKKISENTKILFASSCYIMFSKLELKSGAFSIKINSHEFFPNIMFALVQKF